MYKVEFTSHELITLSVILESKIRDAQHMTDDHPIVADIFRREANKLTEMLRKVNKALE